MSSVNNTFEFGDIIATRSNSFISKSIRWFMRQYKAEADDFSHNAVVINIWGEQWVVEALAWGVRVWTIEQSGYIRNKNVVVLRDKRGFTEQQIDKMSKRVVSLGGVRYQYSNLFGWVAKIWFKLNFFKKENEKSIYCSELAAIAINTVYPGTFPTPNMVNPADHLLSKNYVIIDPNDLLKEMYMDHERNKIIMFKSTKQKHAKVVI